MTIKKNLENEVDDSWRRKGHLHEGMENWPEVCPDCGGFGYVYDEECETCSGTGEIW